MEYSGTGICSMLFSRQEFGYGVQCPSQPSHPGRVLSPLLSTVDADPDRQVGLSVFPLNSYSFPGPSCSPGRKSLRAAPS